VVGLGVNVGGRSLRTIAVVFLAAFFALPAAGQAPPGSSAPEAPPPAAACGWKDKIFFGGGVGLSFGDIDYVGWRR
jgi:hypothetical protein